MDIDNADRPATWPAADVAIDFSTAAAVPATCRHLAARGTNVVIGTTGWQEHEAATARELAALPASAWCRRRISRSASTCSWLSSRARQSFRRRSRSSARGFTRCITRTKKDAPSGTALGDQRRDAKARIQPPIDVASTRAGSIPGTHTVGFDGPAETITLTHTARDRAGFARGALEAAQWVNGSRGWFTMRDVLGCSRATSHDDSLSSRQLRKLDALEERDANAMDGLRNGAGHAVHARRRGRRGGVRRLARRQIDAGIHFLVPCGTTGESPTLTEDERVRVVQLVVEEAAGRVPVLAGAGGYDTKEVIHSRASA